MNTLMNTSQVKAKKRSFPVFEFISFLVLFLYAVSLFIPLLWSLMSSFKGRFDFLKNAFSFPIEFVNNYEGIFDRFVVPVSLLDGTSIDVGFIQMLGNSAWYAIGSAFISTTVAFMVAYVVARFKFKFCEVIYTVVILQMIIPTVGTLPSELRIANELGLYDTPYGILFMKSYVTGLYFLSFYGALRVIPRDYEEAAQLDGAGNLTVMVRIITPMVSGVFTTVLLLTFITFWNDYQTPLIYIPSYPTLAYGLWHYINVDSTGSVPMKLSGCMVMAVPLFVLFIAFQNKLMGNVSVGGLK